MKIEETYYLVEYNCMYNGRTPEGVFTEKAWKKYIKEENKSRDGSCSSKFDEDMDDNEDFVFTEIEIYN